jgi:hypothetical protein
MPGARARRVVPGVLFAVALGAWCGWASGFHQSTTGAFATWAASLAGVVAIDLLLWRGRGHRRLAWAVSPAEQHWPRPGQGGPRRALLGVAPWLVLFLAILAWELLGIDTPPKQIHLTISALAQEFRPLDAALLLLWILVGIGYGVTRARAPTLSRPASGLGRGHSQDGSASAVAVAAVSVGHLTPIPALLLPQDRAVGVAFWLAVIVVAMFVDFTARRSRGRVATGEEFLRLISGPPVARFFLIVAWTFGGWHLFAH